MYCVLERLKKGLDPATRKRVPQPGVTGGRIKSGVTERKRYYLENISLDCCGIFFLE
jgi:hypothetical protein